MGFRADRGSALVVALLVCFILALLGVSFLLMAQTESRIAANELYALQALYLADAGSTVVQSWFDRPGSALDFPAPATVRRTLREVLDEDDPYEGSRTVGTRYKQVAESSTDVDLDNDGVVDLFRPPYRGGDAAEHALMGARNAPDMVIDDGDIDPSMGRFLDGLSLRILGPRVRGHGSRGKISRIAIYAPPYLPVDGDWSRFGIATVEVTARIYRLDTDGDETDLLAQRTVSTVLNEIPYGRPVFGPLHACADLRFSGRLNAHWGPVTTGADLLGYDEEARNIPYSLPRQNPPGPRIDRLWVAQATKAECLFEFNGRATGEIVPDPWLRVVARGLIDQTSNPLKNQPYDETLSSYPASPCDSGRTVPALDCCDRSNLFQSHPLVRCPEYDYEFWKSIARSGRSDVHYFVPDGAADRFREGGVGVAVTFAEATDGRRGLFFFDTTDSLPPRDEDLDGDLDNVVDLVAVGEDWQSAGFVYLNARVFEINGPLTPPRDVAVRAPGEPFLDANHNRLYDPGEAWVNLEYSTTVDGAFRVNANEDSNDSGGLSANGAVRNSQGPFEIKLPVSFAGIIYTSGDVTADGSGAFYGSVIARGKITLGSEGGSPDFYWDERISRRWPPVDESGLPRVVATRWDQAP